MDSMNVAQAAAVLGVPIDADAAQVRRAYRMWARMAHPDAGGDADSFARLTHARRTMLRARHGNEEPSPASRPLRPPISAMLQVPAHLSLLVATACVVIALAALPRTGMNDAVAALVAGLAAATWSFAATRAVLRSGADAGHRIIVLAATWFPLAVGQVLLGLVLDTGIITVLPLLALPFVAIVASVNAGAGLWQPSGRASL